MRIPPIERTISNLSPIPEEPEEIPPFSLPEIVTNALKRIRLQDYEEIHIYQYLSARTRIGYNVYIAAGVSSSSDIAAGVSSTSDIAASENDRYTNRLEKFVIPMDYKLTEDHWWILEEL